MTLALLLTPFTQWTRTLAFLSLNASVRKSVVFGKKAASSAKGVSRRGTWSLRNGRAVGMWTVPLMAERTWVMPNEERVVWHSATLMSEM